MKSGAHNFALALAVALVCANVPLHSAVAGSISQMKPMRALSLDVGDKHIVGYFLGEDGACKLTLMIGDALRETGQAKPSRVVVSIAVDRSAKFDTVEGKTLSFACENGAQAMSVAELDHLAL